MSILAHETANSDRMAPTSLDTSGFISLFIRLSGASIWSIALAVMGLWILVAEALPGFLAMLTFQERVLVGFGMLCGGQLIFLYFVAERLFSRTPRGLTLRVHWVLTGMGALCFVLVIAGRMIDGGLG